jgi:hypothetical protein
MQSYSSGIKEDAFSPSVKTWVETCHSTARKERLRDSSTTSFWIQVEGVRGIKLGNEVRLAFRVEAHNVTWGKSLERMWFKQSFASVSTIGFGSQAIWIWNLTIAESSFHFRRYELSNTMLRSIKQPGIQWYVEQCDNQLRRKHSVLESYCSFLK